MPNKKFHVSLLIYNKIYFILQQIMSSHYQKKKLSDSIFKKTSQK